MRGARGVPIAGVIVAAASAFALGAGPQASPRPAPPPSPRVRPTPSPSPAAATPRPPLSQQVEGQVEKVLEDHDDDLRFDTEVEVVGVSAEEALARHFREFDLECGPAGGGAPSAITSREARPHPAPYLDYLALARLLSGDRPKGPPRYFLYRLHRGETTVYSVREARLNESEAYGLGGGAVELVESFPDLGSAVRAWRRMERGFGSPTGSDAAPPPPWATTTCRPRKR